MCLNFNKYQSHLLSNIFATHDLSLALILCKFCSKSHEKLIKFEVISYAHLTCDIEKVLWEKELKELRTVSFLADIRALMPPCQKFLIKNSCQGSGLLKY